MELRGRSLYSGYQDQNHCVFIHIPKTAGTSVVCSLFGQNSRHARWTEYYESNPDKFQQYFKFCFVRNPWDRLLSAYTFLRQGGMNDTDARWAKDNLECFDSFESFVHEWLTEDSIWSWVHFVPQYHWVCDDEGHCMMDFVGRMETINSDFKIVAERLEREAVLPVRNSTRTKHYSSYYTSEMQDLVRNIYRRDISHFNYNFNTQST